MCRVLSYCELEYRDLSDFGDLSVQHIASCLSRSTTKMKYSKSNLSIDKSYMLLFIAAIVRIHTANKILPAVDAFLQAFW